MFVILTIELNDDEVKVCVNVVWNVDDDLQLMKIW
jgi:hypothetical protein